MIELPTLDQTEPSRPMLCFACGGSASCERINRIHGFQCPKCKGATRTVRIQWKPNYIANEKRICLTRLRWERGVVGDGKGYSVKLSISLCWKWQDLWVGIFVKPRLYGWYAWICVIPCLPVRLSFQRSYGGIFP